MHPSQLLQSMTNAWLYRALASASVLLMKYYVVIRGLGFQLSTNQSNRIDTSLLMTAMLSFILFTACRWLKVKYNEWRCDISDRIYLCPAHLYEALHIATYYYAAVGIMALPLVCLQSPLEYLSNLPHTGMCVFVWFVNTSCGCVALQPFWDAFKTQRTPSQKKID